VASTSVVIGAAVFLGGGCGPGGEPAAAREHPTRAGDEGSWTLVYEQENDGNVELYLASDRGGPPRRLTEHPTFDGHARWMPDGKRLIFTSNRSGTPQLWELEVPGGGLRRVRRNEAGESQPDPSPDGRQVAFLSDIDGPQVLMVEDLVSGKATELVRHRQRTIFGNPHWSPDGSLIAFSSSWPRGHRIYVLDVATGETREVAKGCEPRFNREGTGLAYVSRRSGDETSKLVEVALETGEERVLIDWPAFNYDLAYSPDGREVAFASNISGEWMIYRQRLSDGKAWQVTFGGGPARYPDYRPEAGPGS
jgi:Tol biopolymer transport system component